MAHNGHKSWPAWNVSLWLNNDEGLYNMMHHAVRFAPNREYAAQTVLESLNEMGITETPDGARYTKTSILLAMRGL